MSTSIPTGSEMARPFLPAKDFSVSKRFYEVLGFTKILDGDSSSFAVGFTGISTERDNFG